MSNRKPKPRPYDGMTAKLAPLAGWISTSTVLIRSWLRSDAASSRRSAGLVGRHADHRISPCMAG